MTDICNKPSFCQPGSGETFVFLKQVLYHLNRRYPLVTLALIMAALSLAAGIPLRVQAQDRPAYTIYRADTPVEVDGRLDEPSWTGAPDVGAFVFPWYKNGKKEQTVAKLLWDDTHLYVAFICEDDYIWAEHTQRDSAVYLDDAVEVFTAPNPERPLDYFNIEMNVLGIFLDNFQSGRPAANASKNWNGKGIRIKTTVKGTLNDDSDKDQYWILEAAIPFQNFSEVAQHTPPEAGSTWHMNLNRLGGNSNEQFSQWSASKTARPDFHVPQDFGRVTFSNSSSPFRQKQRTQVSKEIVYVGTFADRGSEGLYVFEYDRENGQMNHIQTVSDREAPDFQALHPGGHYLYSVSDEAFSDETDDGTITAYRIDPETGMLSLINEQPVKGRGPAHVSVDPKGRFAYVSNYSGGNLSVFAIDSEDGGLSPAAEVVQHEGSSINEERQNAPHVHSAVPSPDGDFVYVSDLGTDRIMIYKVDGESGELSPAEVPYAESNPGSGPRHFTFHPKGGYAYSAEELSSTVAVFQADPSTGALTQIQRVSMLPEDYDDKSGNSAADIHISPDGRFLYASNRGHDSLVIYEIDQDSGELSLAGHEPTRGGHPRNFMMDRRGAYVMVANMDDDNVVVFKRNQKTGELSYTGQQVEVPMPVCLTQHFIEK